MFKIILQVRNNKVNLLNISWKFINNFFYRRRYASHLSRIQRNWASTIFQEWVSRWLGVCNDPVCQRARREKNCISSSIFSKGLARSARFCWNPQELRAWPQASSSHLIIAWRQGSRQRCGAFLLTQIFRRSLFRSTTSIYFPSNSKFLV